MYEAKDFFDLAEEIFPFCRSITGTGVRNTFSVLQRIIPDLKVHEVETGTVCFDWTVPKEWNISDAFIETPSGQKICKFSDTNLHVLNYSTPINKKISLGELQKHLYSLPEKPHVVPYVTSYYEERWGFCISHADREQLVDGDYRVVIDSELEDGSLSLADFFVKGKTEKEIFISTYTCHPSMGNNETSGIVLATMLAKWLADQDNLHYSYRIVFAPETIGPLVYLSDKLTHLRENVIAAFNLTCVGDNSHFSFLPSKSGDTIADKVATHCLAHLAPDYVTYDFINDRGSDENQYSSPGVDIPMVSIMRSKYGTYKEYHTSEDDLNFISGEGLKTSFEMHKKCIETLERIHPLQATIIGEPWYSKHKLRPTVGGIDYNMDHIYKFANLMMFADGKHNILDIAEMMKIPVWDLFEFQDKLINAGLLRRERTKDEN